MALQYKTELRNSQLDAIETYAGTSPVLRIYVASAPANANTALSGQTQLVSMTLPSDWMQAAGSGQKLLNGSWSGTAGNNGTAAFFRIYKSGLADPADCVMQGTCGMGSGDMSLDNTSIATGQTVTVTTFTITAGNS
jgi:hypothetical protein